MNRMICRGGIALLMVMAYSVVAGAQDRFSLRPIFKSGDESRYSISALVETNITAGGSPTGFRGNSRRELQATIAVRTVNVTQPGEIGLEVTVETISFNSTTNIGGSQPPVESDVAGRTILLTISPSGQLLKCTLPQSQAYRIVLDSILSLVRWHPSGDVTVGQTWQAFGQGPVYSAELSPISKDATTSYKLASAAGGIATLEGTVTLKEVGTSAVNPALSAADIAVIANGSGSTRVEADIATGRVISGATESRIEGTLSHTQPGAEGEKPERRTGSLVETAKFSIKLIK